MKQTIKTLVSSMKTYEIEIITTTATTQFKVLEPETDAEAAMGLSDYDVLPESIAIHFDMTKEADDLDDIKVFSELNSEIMQKTSFVILMRARLKL